jgi:hypothetical protein
MFKNKKFIVSIVLMAILCLVGITLYFTFFKTDISTSPNHRYTVYYNKFTKTVVTTGDARGYFSPSGLKPAKAPEFHWSSDSRFLSENYYDVRGYSWCQFTDFKYNRGITVPTKSEIENICKETLTKDKDNNLNANIYVEEWLDNNHALVHFSWPSDIPGKTISGWFTCEITDDYQVRIAQDIHVSK